MQGWLSHYLMLAKRWVWMIALGIVFCGSVTYVVSAHQPPVYQASTVLIINQRSAISAYDNITASELAVATYAPLLTNPTVLEPVVARHQGIAVQQLSAMIIVKPESNTQLIELDVKDTNPRLAMQLANEISQSFVHYLDANTPATAQIVEAQLPTDPISPRPLPYASVGALVGLGLALALIVIFEWIDDLPRSSEEVQELLDLEILTDIPKIQLKLLQPNNNVQELPALGEGCHQLYASLEAKQAVKPSKLVMVTSALASEGKSIITAKLASLVAREGKSVLLVDANLRQPVLDQRFELENHFGLADALRVTETPQEEKWRGQETSISNLRVLTAGAIPSNPADLLQSLQAKKLFEHFKQAPFDYILFDTPPLLPVADAQILASYVDAQVLVVDVSKTSRRLLARTRSLLNRLHPMILGVAINKSLWSNIGDMRQYLHEVQQSKTGSTMITPESIPAAGDGDNFPDSLTDSDNKLMQPHQ